MSSASDAELTAPELRRFLLRAITHLCGQDITWILHSSDMHTARNEFLRPPVLFRVGVCALSIFAT